MPGIVAPYRSTITFTNTFRDLAGQIYVPEHIEFHIGGQKFTYADGDVVKTTTDSFTYEFLANQPGRYRRWWVGYDDVGFYVESNVEIILITPPTS